MGLTIKIKPLALFIVSWLTFFSFTPSFAALPIHIVAIENFYGALANEIGGPYVQVTSLLNNPNQDPHLFSTNVSTVKAITNADILIYNGANYDPWILPLLATRTVSHSSIIVIAQLIPIAPRANPHLWYNPIVMPLYATTLTQLLITKDPLHKDFYQHSLLQFQLRYQTLNARIHIMKQQYQGSAITATEPVFNEMARALGLQMRNEAFQMEIMNDTEPSPSQIRTFEDDLNQHRVKLLVYNNQVSNPFTQHIKDIAQQAGIAIVGVSETQPLNEDYINWMLRQLNQIDHALKNGANTQLPTTTKVIQENRKEQVH